MRLGKTMTMYLVCVLVVCVYGALMSPLFRANRLSDGCQVRDVDHSLENVEMARFVIGEILHVCALVVLPYTTVVFTAAKRRTAKQLQREKDAALATDATPNFMSSSTIHHSSDRKDSCSDNGPYNSSAVLLK